MTTLPQRIVKISVGPAGGQGRQWQNPLFIEFDVIRTTGRNPNKASVNIYNLTSDSRQWLEQPNQVLQILAGEGTPGQIFLGDIEKRGVTTKIQNEDTVITIKAADGRRKWRDSVFSKSYPPNISRDVVLNDVIAAIGLPTGYIATLPAMQFAGGYASSGWARDILTDILYPDAEWSIQDGSLQIILTGQGLPGNAVVINAQTGMIGSPTRTDKGVNVTTTLTRQIAPGGPVRIESRLFTGDLKVTKVQHKGNSKGLVWQTQVTGVPI